MKKTKSLRTLLATLMLIVLLSTMCFAAGTPITSEAKTGKITVNKVEAGAEVSIYQLTTVNFDYTAKQPEGTPYTWVDSVKTWLESKDEYKTYTNPETFYEALKGNADETKAFYSSLVGAMQANPTMLTAKDTKTAEGTLSYSEVTDKTVEFTGCEMGTYLILIDGYMVYAPLAVNLTPENSNGTWVLNDAVVDAKSTPVQITKTVTEKNYSTNDSIPYTIVADVPNYAENSTAHTLYISDVLEAGLTFNNDTTFKVYGVNGDSETELVKDTDFTLIATGAKTDKVGTADATFAVDFKYDSVKNYKKVKIAYTAKLNKDTSIVLGTVGNGNTANLVYNNNPYVETAYKTQTTSKVTVYTYGIKVTKVDKTDTTKKLPGAEFELKNGEEKLYFVGSNGKYYLAKNTDTDATTVLAVDAQGELNLYGLDEGTYTLTETKAPEGYNIATTSETIIIADANADGKLDDAEDNTGIISILFKNTNGFTLPVTGGIGTVIFAVVGVIFVALGGILIIATKRNKANK